MRGTRVLLILAALFCAKAQSGSAVVSGMVEDPTRASVPGATVHLHRRPIGAPRDTKTDATGAFRFDGVAPGEYELDIEQPGFRRAVSRLNVGMRSPSPLRIVLTLADRREGVTVQENALQVNTES